MLIFTPFATMLVIVIVFVFEESLNSEEYILACLSGRLSSYLSLSLSLKKVTCHRLCFVFEESLNSEKYFLAWLSGGLSSPLSLSLSLSLKKV